MATAVTVSKTNNAEIDGLLGGTKWSGTITYSFPDSPSDYPSTYSSKNEPTTEFSQTPAAEQQAVTYAVALILSYTNASIQYAGTNGADIRVAQSSAANPTSFAYYPSNSSTGTGGDVWFGNEYDYSQAALGNYYFATAIHELGHAFGLKHSQETGGVANVAVPAAHDGLEYTVMSYRSYIGGPATGYTNEAVGFPQTYMANDILALQTLYGANFTTHSENTVYSWDPATGREYINGVAQLAPGTGTGGSSNRVFMTIWDGNGVDTYDLSNYASGVTINLNPGAFSITSAVQLANLGSGHYASGNIYNAYLYNNDARSYIDNAIGGAGDDTLTGNAIGNNLNGGAGSDTLTGGGGNDVIVGGSGSDIAVFSGSSASYLITYNSGTQTFTVADQRGGSPDGTDTVSSVENFQFADGTFASSSFIVVNHAPTNETISGSTVAENSPNGTFVGTVTGFDPDAGTVLLYSMIDSAGGRFAINANTGQLLVSNGSLLDYESATSHTIVVRATDQGGLFVDKAFAITVANVNEAPTGITLSGNSIAENSPGGTIIGTAAGIDPDANTAFSYSLLDNAGGRFLIYSSSGILVNVSSQTIDYEAAHSYSVTVRATDQAGLSVDKNLTVNLTNVNERPTGIILSGNSIAENSPGGTIVGTAAGIDPDAGAVFSYSLLDDAGGRFLIYPSSGIVVNVSSQTIDYEAAHSYSVTVRATDQGGLFTDKTFTVQLQDVPGIVLNGNEGDNRLVGTKESDTLNGLGGTDILTGGGGNDTIDGGLNADTAVFSGNKADYQINFNAGTQTFTVTDQRPGSPDGSDTLTNIESFQFADGVFVPAEANHAPSNATLSGGVIAENSPRDTVVGTVTASDPDAGNVLKYSLVNDEDGFFRIDPDTGQVTVADGSHLDYETASSYSITVHAVDQGGLSIDKTFAIQLTDMPGVTPNGDGGNNTLTGSPENDTINGLGGDDILTGGHGNDAIDGGAGADIAVFSGNLADYQVNYNAAAQTFTISDLRQGSPDGTDSVGNVETFQFADGSFTFDTAGGALNLRTVTYLNGAHSATAFDTAGNQSWVWATSNDDAGGHLTLQTGLNDNGTHWLTFYDVNNTYSWADATINFDAEWQRTSVTGTRDDGSHSLTMDDVAAVYDTTNWSTTPFNTSVTANAATTLVGGPANDVLVGNAGNDTFSGGAGNDVLVGGGGNDTFVFAPGSGQDTIMDFHHAASGNNDLIDVTAYHLNPSIGPGGIVASDNASGDAVIQLDMTGDTITLHGIHAASLTSDYFLF